MLEDPIEENLKNTKYKNKFNDEYHEDYCHFQGAVGVGKYTAIVEDEITMVKVNAFYIVTKDYIEEDILQIMKDPNENTGYPPEVVRTYKKYGGLYELDFEYTIFGQVYKGFDILKKINKLYEDINNEEAEVPIIYNIEIVKFD